ncbi:hypothetical protein P154DRAFT_617919 [Amniculicola lignicola CBS 123094]|uniref:Uncharacterized protein n=1 Tax=Amniculicola lignicola CBS 123094 TaxID=1392246 RepID=A0A6A5X0C3_9PLEO|nr:hypothetical protein P154DRAFT_617919 [Amniculicola lignicola CBS 123094]
MAEDALRDLPLSVRSATRLHRRHPVGGSIGIESRRGTSTLAHPGTRHRYDTAVPWHSCGTAESVPITYDAKLYLHRLLLLVTPEGRSPTNALWPDCYGRPLPILGTHCDDMGLARCRTGCPDIRDCRLLSIGAGLPLHSPCTATLLGVGRRAIQNHIDATAHNVWWNRAIPAHTALAARSPW